MKGLSKIGNKAENSKPIGRHGKTLEMNSFDLGMNNTSAVSESFCNMRDI